MKKLFSVVLISFILFTNLAVPVSVFAVTPDVLTVITSSGPQDNTVSMTDPMNFSVVFDAPTIPKEVAPPNKNYNVFFQAKCLYSNGTIFKMPPGDDNSGGHYIVSNLSKFEAGKSLNLTDLTKKWTFKLSADKLGTTACPTNSDGAPIGINWTLREIDSADNTVKEYLNKSFTLKTVQSFNIPGFYYVYKDGGGSYKASIAFADSASCIASWNSVSSNYPSYKIYTECQYFSDAPTTPKDAVVNVAPQNGTSGSSIYTMLAPIGDIKCMDNTGTDKSCISNNIGEYLNVIFKLAIGICALLAVIMLIINGITYMGDESIFSKTEAKSKMYSAIIGLLIALGAWALLNTINPALTGLGGINIDPASVDVETQPLVKNDPYTEGTTTSKCPEGIVTAVTVNGNIPICKSLQGQLVAIIAKAKTVGINLFGYGYRSKATQEGLRSKNCGGASSVYNTTAQCSPQTAIPGTSMHENGLAVDFRCDGVQISTQDNKCFLWLKANATPPFLNSLAAEPWHWSTTGH